MALVLIVCAFVGLATALWPDLVSSLLFSISVFAPCVLWACKEVPDEDRRYILRLVTVAFAVRLICSYTVEALQLIDKPDATGYHLVGTVAAQHMREGRFIDSYRWALQYSSHPGYYLLVGLIYAVFGPNMLLGQNLNALISALTVIPIYLLGREILPDARVARLAALGFSWFPNSIIWSTQLLKDSLIVFLEVLLVLDLLRVLNRRATGYTFARLLLSTLILAEIRFYLPVLVYGSCGLAFVASSWRAGAKRSAATQAFALTLLVTTITGIVLTGRLWAGYLGKIEHWYDLDVLRSSTLGGGSDFAREVRLTSAVAILKFLPTGAAFFLAGPLPWKATKLTHYLTWLDIPIWYPALLMGAPGMLLLLRRRQGIPLVGICLGLTFFYSLLLANLGTAYRMRLQIIPFFLITAAYWYYTHAVTPCALTDSTRRA